MPNGVPVATVALNAAKNAGILAAQILSTADDGLRDKIVRYKSELAEGVASKYRKLESEGYETYSKD
jgi:5-(carboxyamino)imidazole ribonucleotide mutase